MCMCVLAHNQQRNIKNSDDTKGLITRGKAAASVHTLRKRLEFRSICFHSNKFNADSCVNSRHY